MLKKRAVCKILYFSDLFVKRYNVLQQQINSSHLNIYCSLHWIIPISIGCKNGYPSVLHHAVWLETSQRLQQPSRWCWVGEFVPERDVGDTMRVDTVWAINNSEWDQLICHRATGCYTYTYTGSPTVTLLKHTAACGLTS